MPKRRKYAKRREFRRYSIVGFGTTLLDYGILNILNVALGLPLITSNIVSASSSSYVSYTLNKKIVFVGNAHSEKRSLLLYAATIAIGILVIQTTVLLILGHGLIENIFKGIGLDGTLLQLVSTNVSKAAAGISTFAWNFLIVRKYIFVSNDASKNG